MRYLRSSNFHISSLPAGLKLVLSLYLLATLLGVVVSALKFTQRMDPTPTSARNYYLGSTEPLNQDQLVGELVAGKSAGFLADTTHPHLFMVPLVLLVVCHLAHLTRVRTGLLATLDLMAFFGFFAMFGSPWGMALAPGLFSFLFVVGAVCLTLGLAILCTISLVAMWRGQEQRSVSPSPGQE